MKTTLLETEPSIAAQVRKMKEDHAAQYNFDLDAIVAAANEWEKLHPERMATPEQISGLSNSPQVSKSLL